MLSFFFYLFYFPKKMQSFALILALLSRAWRTRCYSTEWPGQSRLLVGWSCDSIWQSLVCLREHVEVMFLE